MGFVEARKEFEKSLPAALNEDVESKIFIALLYANGEGVHLSKTRHSANREFFKCSIKEAVKCIQ